MEIDERLDRITTALDILSGTVAPAPRSAHRLWFAIGVLSAALALTLYWLWLTQSVLRRSLDQRIEHQRWLENALDLMMDDPKRSDSARQKWRIFKDASTRP